MGDGLITAGIVEPEALGKLRTAAIAAATEAGRSTEDFPFTVELAIPSIQRPGEEIDSPRMLSMLQPLVSMNYAVYILAGTDPDELAPQMRDGYARFSQWAHEQNGDDPRLVHRRVSEKLIGRIPEHDPFVTAGAIRGVTLAGPLEEVIERLRGIESAGATDLAFTVEVDRPLATSAELEDLTTIAEAIG